MDLIMFALSAAACAWLTFDATEEMAALFISYIDTYVIYALDGDVPARIPFKIEAEAYMYATASHGVAEPVRRTTRREYASKAALTRSRRRESAHKFNVFVAGRTYDRRGHRVTGFINDFCSINKPVDLCAPVPEFDSGMNIDFPDFDVEDYITYRMEYCN